MVDHSKGVDQVVVVSLLVVNGGEQQAADLASLKLDPAITLTEGDLGVVELGLHQVGAPGRQSLGPDEIGEFESATDAGGVVVEFPGLDTNDQILGLPSAQAWHATLTGNAGLRCEGHFPSPTRPAVAGDPSTD